MILYVHQDSPTASSTNSVPLKHVSGSVQPCGSLTHHTPAHCPSERERKQRRPVLRSGREHAKTGSLCPSRTGLGRVCVPSRGQVKLNVYSGLMSSCQEAAHGLGRLLDEHDRGAPARPERRRRSSSLSFRRSHFTFAAGSRLEFTLSPLKPLKEL